MAAATENYDNGKNDDPGAVIIKDVAEAIAVHMCQPFRMFFMRVPRTLAFYEDGIFLLQAIKNSNFRPS